MKRWVGQKLLPKEIGSNRKKTTKGFGSFFAVLFYTSQLTGKDIGF
jgi:hypothetical protein